MYMMDDFFYQIRWQWSVTPTKDLVQEKRLKGRQKLISNWRIQWSWKGDFWLWKQTRQWFWKMRPARKSLPGQTIPGINDAHTDRDELKTPTGLPQWMQKGPDFGTWSRSGPMSKNSPEKGPICLSSPEVHKCDFELCTDATVCILFLRGRHHQLQYSICTVNLWKKYVKT